MHPLVHLHLERLKLTPGQEWDGDTGGWQFVRCDSGAAYWLGAPKPRFFNEGELLVLPPHTKAIIRASQLNDVTLDEFKFVPDLLGGFFTVAEHHAMAASRDQPTPVQFFPSTHRLSQRFTALTANPPSWRLIERAELLALAIGFLSETVHPTQSYPKTASSAESRFDEIVTKMPDTELLHYTTSQLAQLCGCSPRHFHRLFRQRFGQSPRIHQTELRLLKSRQLLSSTDQEIVQIARASGYRSISLFNSLFKRRFGMSPSAWREHIQTP
jgi:AraC-like DNA-binding protein